MTAPPGIADRALQGAGWMMSRRVAGNVVRLATVAVLARHLSPAQFGVVALAQVVLQFVTLVGEAGFGTYVIYDAEAGRQERVTAVFWLNLVVTTAQCGVVLAVLPFVGRFFGNGHQLTAVLSALVAVFFIRQLAIVPEAVLLRELRHRVVARRDIVVDTAVAVLSVGLALGGAGVWSLVIPSLVFEPVRLVATSVAARFWPRLPFHVSQWRRILRYTAPLMGSNVLIPVSNDGDTLLVARLLGASAVGWYSVAWQLSNMVGRNVTAVVSSITMPALALLRDDADRLRAAYLRMVSLLSVVCLPLLAGMAVVAGDLVPAIYGPRWQPAVTLLRIFIGFTLVRSLTSPSSMVYNVTGRPDIGFRLTLWFTPVYLAAVVAGSRWGAVGIASGVTVARTGGALVDTWLAARQIDLPLAALGRAVWGAAGLTAAMSGAVLAAQLALGAAGVGGVWRLLTCTVLGGGLYALGLVVVRPSGADDFWRSLRSGLVAAGRRRQAAVDPVPARGPA